MAAQKAPSGRRRHRLLLLPALLPAACEAPAPETGAALQQVVATHRASLVSFGFAATPASFPANAPQPSVPAPSQAGQLIGQPPETVLRWLGPPRLRRAEGSAEIWHYQASACHLDLVLYPERDGALPPRVAGDATPLRVAHASARAAGAERRSEQACLQEIATTPRQDSGGDGRLTAAAATGT
jgi:hypothetical protein